MIGGMAGLNKGGKGFFTARFDAGNYLLLCFVPDSTGKPHFLRGMHKLISVS